MSTDTDMVLFSNSNLPSHLQGELDAATKSLMNTGGPKSRSISIKGGVWRMKHGSDEVAKNENRSMNVVIVASSLTVGRKFFKDAYVEGAKVSPTCWSADGKTPSPEANDPQASTCEICPQNIAGSGQKNSRACKYSQYVAVVLENDLGGEVYQLVLPAASVFGEGEPNKWPLRTYATMLGNQGCPLMGVVTEMRFDTDAAVPKLFFRPIRALTAAEYGVVKKKGNTAEAIKAITMAFVKDAAEEEQVPQPALPKAVAASEKGEVEPVKVSPKKAEPATSKESLAKLAAEWD